MGQRDEGAVHQRPKPKTGSAGRDGVPPSRERPMCICTYSEYWGKLWKDIKLLPEGGQGGFYSPRSMCLCCFSIS